MPRKHGAYCQCDRCIAGVIAKSSAAEAAYTQPTPKPDGFGYYYDRNQPWIQDYLLRRYLVVDLLATAAVYIGIGPELADKAMRFVDRIILKSKELAKTHWQNLAIACLSITARFHGTELKPHEYDQTCNFHVHDVVSRMNAGSQTRSDVIRYELFALQKLDYDFEEFRPTYPIPVLNESKSEPQVRRVHRVRGEVTATVAFTTPGSLSTKVQRAVEAVRVTDGYLERHYESVGASDH